MDILRYAVVFVVAAALLTGLRKKELAGMKNKKVYAASVLAVALVLMIVFTVITLTSSKAH